MSTHRLPLILVSHIYHSNQPAFAISVDLGQTTGTSESLVWAIGLIRDPVIKTLTASGTNELRRSYFWTNFTTDIAVVRQ